VCATTAAAAAILAARAADAGPGFSAVLGFSGVVGPGACVAATAWAGVAACGASAGTCVWAGVTGSSGSSVSSGGSGVRSLTSVVPAEVATEAVVVEFASATGSGVRSNSDTASSACAGVGPASVPAGAVVSILPKSAPALSNTSGSMSSPSSCTAAECEVVGTLRSASGGGGPSRSSGSISSGPAGGSSLLENPSAEEDGLTDAAGAACAGAGRLVGSPPSMGASTGRSARGSSTSATRGFHRNSGLVT